MRKKRPVWDKKYGKMVKRIIERDENKCRICNGSEDLLVHHIDREPFNNKDSNLITLCRGCHRTIHTVISVKKSKGKYLLRKLTKGEWSKITSMRVKEGQKNGKYKTHLYRYRNYK